MLNHRNGHWFNTKCSQMYNVESIKVYASRDIKAGEELYGSYNMCEDCELRMHSYGTPDILGDYGFVEHVPQRWFFEEYGIAFEVDAVT
eukprot:12278387-Ditylum_brightwellii.AAC.1